MTAMSVPRLAMAFALALHALPARSQQDGHVDRSRKLCTLWPVCHSHRALVPIVGDFVLMPEVSPAPDYPTFEGLGTTHNLYWLDADELATWEAALGI